jgi:hypothetical protein
LDFRVLQKCEPNSKSVTDDEKLLSCEFGDIIEIIGSPHHNGDCYWSAIKVATGERGLIAANVNHVSVVQRRGKY